MEHSIDVIGRERQQEIRDGKHLATFPPLYVVYDQRETCCEPDTGFDQSTSLFDERSEVKYVEKDDSWEPGEELSVSYHDVFVTVCFTRAGAEDFIQAERHNLSNPRIYVHYIPRRNHELVAIGKLFGDC